MVEPAKNSIWNYLIPLWQLEQVSSTFGRRGVEVSLTSHSVAPVFVNCENSALHLAGDVLYCNGVLRRMLL